MKKVLITGGAGFIGSHLAAALVDAGVHVRVLDNFSTGKASNLSGLPVEVVAGDVGDWEVVATAVSECDTIFHLAALVSVPRSLRDPMLNHRSNVTGAFNVFEAARQAGVRRVVYSSSAAVYGNTPELPKREESQLQLLTPYAAAKYMNEMMAAMYHEAYGLESIGLRYMNVYGPRQDPSSPYSGVLSIFCKAAVSDGDITIFGDGEQTRDFVYVADVVQANLRAASVMVNDFTPGEVCNIGYGMQISLNDIVTQLRQLSGSALPLTYAAPREGDIRHSVANIDRARAVLNYEPTTSIAEGLDETLAWFRRQRV